MNADPALPQECPTCGADVVPKSVVCWLCKSPLLDRPADAPILAEVWAPPALEDPGTSTRYLIVSVLLTVLLSVGIGTVYPGLGILIGICLTPALIRTSTLVARRQREGRTVEFGERALVFAGSLAAVIAAGMAAAIAFFATCIVSCFGVAVVNTAASGGGPMNTDNFFLIVLSISGILGLAVGALVLATIWKLQK